MPPSKPRSQGELSALITHRWRRFCGVTSAHRTSLGDRGPGTRLASIASWFRSSSMVVPESILETGVEGGGKQETWLDYEVGEPPKRRLGVIRCPDLRVLSRGTPGPRGDDPNFMPGPFSKPGLREILRTSSSVPLLLAGKPATAHMSCWVLNQAARVDLKINGQELPGSILFPGRRRGLVLAAHPGEISGILVVRVPRAVSPAS
ncbi:hypothetical protein BaRGS_00000555, partial [Batillaria attramentaria]